MRLLRVRTKCILLKCILHDNLFSSFVLDILFLFFGYKVLLFGLPRLYRAITALVRQDLLSHGPKLGRLGWELSDIYRDAAVN